MPTMRPSSGCAPRPLPPMRWSPSGPAPSTISASMPAHATGKPYVVFGTAPSMNGYTSLNAAITVRGHKKSLPAQAPAGAFLDLSILAAAPVRMIRSGLGDSLCRATAQADWLLSHLLFDLPYRTMPFVLLAEDEPELFPSAEELVNGDLDAMEKLVRTLLLSGLRHRDLRQFAARQPGRASDQPLWRHAARSRPPLHVSRRADRRDDLDHGAAAGADARRPAARGLGRPQHGSGFHRAVWTDPRPVLLGGFQPEAPDRGQGGARQPAGSPTNGRRSAPRSAPFPCMRTCSRWS